jgi:hypothetical protein
MQEFAADQVEFRIVGPDFGLSGLASAPGRRLSEEPDNLVA